MQYLSTYHFHTIARPSVSLKVQKCWANVKVEPFSDFDVDKIPITLQLIHTIYEELSGSQGSLTLA